MPGLVDRAEKYLKSRFSDENTTVYLSTDLAHAADGSGRRFADFKLLKIAPAGARDFWIYASVGASARAVNDQYLEFFTLAPLDDHAHIENMVVLVCYHLTSNRPLAPMDVCPIGREWVTGSSLDHFLISRINPIRKELDSLHGEDGCVNFHWAQPIHAQEAAFHQRHGIDQLEEAFEKASTNILALTRDPVV